MRWLATVNLAFAVYAMLAPVAHVLEMPNKLALDGRLWLAVQQHLYRGWGPFIGGPSETGALAATLALMILRWRDHTGRRLLGIAAAGYAAMIAVFFGLNAPVNAIVSTWPSATPPEDWRSLRLRWECGHALAATLAIIAFIILLRARGRRGSSQRASRNPT